VNLKNKKGHRSEGIVGGRSPEEYQEMCDLKNRRTDLKNGRRSLTRRKEELIGLKNKEVRSEEQNETTDLKNRRGH
jgi:hypothetical protein